MKLELTIDEARFIVAAMEAIRVQNKSGLQIKYSIVSKLLDHLPNDSEPTPQGANLRVP
jgi:hypothetical protein